MAACSSVVLRESVSLSGEEVIGSNPVRPTKGDEYVLEGGSSVGRALGSSSWIRYPLEQKYLEVTSSTLVLSAKTYLFFLEPLSMSEGFLFRRLIVFPRSDLGNGILLFLVCAIKFMQTK